MIEAETGFEDGEVHEVTRLRTAEHSKHLVHGEFFGAEDGAELAGLRWEESGIGREVDAGLIGDVADDQPSEAWDDHLPSDGHAGGADGLLKEWQQPIDRGGIYCEEVEVSSQPVELAVDEEGGAAGEDEVACFRQIV